MCVVQRVTRRYTPPLCHLQHRAYDLHDQKRQIGDEIVATRKVEIGPVGHTVRGQVAKIRADKHLLLRDLVDRLADYGRPMGYSTISEIEHGRRRVDVDDLVALATVLGVSPLELLGVKVEVPAWALRPISDAAFAVIQTIIEADQGRGNDGNN